jgi:hypothetical protein
VKVIKKSYTQIAGKYNEDRGQSTLQECNFLTARRQQEGKRKNSIEVARSCIETPQNMKLQHGMCMQRIEICGSKSSRRPRPPNGSCKREEGTSTVG